MKNQTLHVVPDSVEGVIRDYLLLDEQIKALEAQKKSLKVAIEAEAKGAENNTFTAGPYIVNLLSYTQNRLDTDKLKNDKPEVYKAYVKEVECSRLNIKAGSGF